MANTDVVDLIDQAISFENAEIYGVLNLNRLREVLHYLAFREFKITPALCNEKNGTIPFVLNTAGNGSSASHDNNGITNTAQQEASEVSTMEFLKETQINERLSEMEAKIMRIENACFNVPTIHQPSYPSSFLINVACQYDGADSEGSMIKEQITKSNVQRSPTASISSFESIMGTSSAKANARMSSVCLDERNENISLTGVISKDDPPHPIRQSERGDRNEFIHKQQIPISPSNSNEKPSIDQIPYLMNAVNTLLQRVNRMDEIELTIEHKINSCFQNRLHLQNMNETSFSTNLPQNTESVGRIETEIDKIKSFLSELRHALAVVSEEVCLLKKTIETSGNKIAAGSKTAAKLPQTVNCISCDCAATINTRAASIPKTTPFYTKFH